MQEIIIRTATVADAEALVHLHRDVMAQQYGAVDPAALIEAWAGGHTEACWRKRLLGHDQDEPGAPVVVVALDGGRVLAAAGLVLETVTPEPKAASGSLTARIGVYVRPEAQGIGLAKRLFLLLEAQARAVGAEKIELAAPEAAVGFYLAIGCLGVRRERQLFANGKTVEMVVMEKVFDRDQTPPPAG